MKSDWKSETETMEYLENLRFQWCGSFPKRGQMLRENQNKVMQ